MFDSDGQDSWEQMPEDDSPKLWKLIVDVIDPVDGFQRPVETTQNAINLVGEVQGWVGKNYPVQITIEPVEPTER